MTPEQLQLEAVLWNISFLLLSRYGNLIGMEAIGKDKDDDDDDNEGDDDDNDGNGSGGGGGGGDNEVPIRLFRMNGFTVPVVKN